MVQKVSNFRLRRVTTKNLENQHSYLAEILTKYDSHPCIRPHPYFGKINDK